MGEVRERCDRKQKNLSYDRCLAQPGLEEKTYHDDALHPGHMALQLGLH